MSDDEDVERHLLRKGIVYGLDALDLPDGWTPLEAVIVVKGLDEDGDVAICQRFTEGVSTWEALGMVISACDSLRENMKESFQPAERDDEDDDGDDA